MPSMPGSIRSSTTRSGQRSSARASAARPSDAVSTVSPSRSRYRTTTSLHGRVVLDHEHVRPDRSVTMATVPPPGWRSPIARLAARGRARAARRPGPRAERWRRSRASTHGTNGSQIRSTSAFDMPLRSASAIDERARRRRGARARRSRSRARPTAAAGPDRERERGEVAEQEVRVRAAARDAGPVPRRGWPRGPRTTRSRRPRKASARPARRRAPRRASGRSRRRATATTIGTTASSTSPYESIAVTPKSRPPASASRSASRPSRPVARTTRVTAQAETPAKNASPELHQIAAGASTRNGAAARARGFARDLSRARPAPRRPTPRRRRARAQVRTGAAEPDPVEPHSTSTMPGGWPWVWMLYVGELVGERRAGTSTGPRPAARCGGTGRGAADR